MTTEVFLLSKNTENLAYKNISIQTINIWQIRLNEDVIFSEQIPKETIFSDKGKMSRKCENCIKVKQNKSRCFVYIFLTEN